MNNQYFYWLRIKSSNHLHTRLILGYLDCKTVVFFANTSDGKRRCVHIRTKGLERGSRASHSRITLTALRAFWNDWKRLFCSLLVTWKAQSFVLKVKLHLLTQAVLLNLSRFWLPGCGNIALFRTVPWLIWSPPLGQNTPSWELFSKKKLMFYYQTFFLLQICSSLDCS